MTTTNNLAIVFPGQGSQSLGMLADTAGEFSEVKQTFDEASNALGYDLWHITQEGPQETLDKTEYTQPALLTASYVIWRILQNKQPVIPAMLAGHSLGEYTALVCANALSFTDAVKLVAARGKFMQEAVPAGTGAMAAIIGLEESAVDALCAEAVMPGEVLSPANFNSVGQIVIAGHKASVQKATDMAKSKGAKMAVLLPVSVPSHCDLMKPAAERLQQALNDIAIQQPVIPVLNNVDVVLYDSVESIRKGLTQQLYMPVRWVETIQTFARQGITKVIECGPGKVLTGLNKRIDKQLSLTATSDVASLKEVIYA